MAIHTNTSAVYLCTNQELQVEAREEGFDFIFGTDVANNELSFLFESKFEPYQEYSRTDIKGIDLVLKLGDSFIRALEVKLTVIPDDTTANDRESDWGTELVIRPASTSYAALGIFDSIKPFRARLKEILEPTCSTIQHWDNTVEMLSKREEIIGCLNKIFTEFKDYQNLFYYIQYGRHWVSHRLLIRVMHMIFLFGATLLFAVPLLIAHQESEMWGKLQGFIDQR